MIVFLHVPKTGGHTFRSFLVKAFGANAVYYVNIRDQVDSFRAALAAQGESLKAVHGHMPFGIHRIIPQPCFYYACLRSPVERVISSYYFLRGTPRNACHKPICEATQTIDDMVDFPHLWPMLELDNCQTRRLALYDFLSDDWFDWRACPDTTRSHLDQAKETVGARLHDFGLLEHSEESAARFCRHLGLSVDSVPRMNASDGRPSAADLKPTTIEWILEHNRFDTDLYLYAERLFRDRSPVSVAGAA